MAALRNQEHIEAFFRKGKRSKKAWLSDWSDGAKVFFRLNDGDRLNLVAAIIDAWLDSAPYNRAMCSGALRQAWDSEPYIGNRRLGSFISAIAQAAGDMQWSMDEFADAWGPMFMTPEEEKQLQEMQFPLTVYRGGTGTVEEVALGTSWTLSLETAKFYAFNWPRRWGDERKPVILSKEVEECDVYAYLDARQEKEMLIPYPPDPDESMKTVIFADVLATTLSPAV